MFRRCWRDPRTEFEGFTDRCHAVNDIHCFIPCITIIDSMRTLHTLKCTAMCLLVLGVVNGFSIPKSESGASSCPTTHWQNLGRAAAVTLGLVTTLSFNELVWAATSPDAGATSSANAKITTGGASTLQSGRTIAITRGVNLDNSDFSKQNLKGVAFQQSIVRDSNFQGSNLVGASFFDATLDGSNFQDADMSLANVEMAQFNRASLRNTIMREMYVSGSTLFEGVQDIEGSDWTDTYLRKDQTKYLCSHPTAKGINPVTGVGTRESLMCTD